MKKMYPYYEYSDGCSVKIHPDEKVMIELDNECYSFEEENKPVFSYETGETVIEYTGIAADGKQDQSWAKANYKPKAYSVLHFHNFLTEDYYIIHGQATVIINDKKYHLTSGDHVQIKPGQKHQVNNESDTEELVLIVRCRTAWNKEDYNIIQNDLAHEAAEKIESEKLSLSRKPSYI